MIKSQGDQHLQCALDLRFFVVIKLPEEDTLGAKICRSWLITSIVFNDFCFIVVILVHFIG